MDNEITKNNNFEERLSQAQKELTVLYEVSNAMRTTLELDHILYIILTGVTSHAGLGFNRAILFLVNPKDRCLEPKMAIGPDSGEHAKEIWEEIHKSTNQIDDLITEDRVEQNISSSALFNSIKNLRASLTPDATNLLNKVFHDGIPLHIREENILSYQNDPLLQFFKTNEVVIMPLKAKDKVNGLIVADNLYTKKHITDEDLKIFMMLANQAGLAIENSRLYEIVKHKSHTDSLTDLWNHGYFQEKLSDEIKNPSQHHPLSLLLIDIDNFKQLNDQYGHQNGDIILKDIAIILKESSRENDYVCRYGGEEFSIILPNTNKEQAYHIAERIREGIATHSFPKLSEGENPRITISLGLSSCPEDTQIKEDLIALADKALYIAKFSGKNRTCVANNTSD